MARVGEGWAWSPVTLPLSPPRSMHRRRRPARNSRCRIRSDGRPRRSDAPAELEGELSMTYTSEDTWTVDVSKELLWPGIDGAAGFDVVSEWEKRGRILDRSKSVLAKGAVDERSYPQGLRRGDHGRAHRPSVQGGREGGGRGDGRRPRRRLGDGGGVPGGTRGNADAEVAGRRPEGTGSWRSWGRAAGAAGTDVRTTLDVDVQRAAESAYGVDGRRGRRHRSQVRATCSRSCRRRRSIRTTTSGVAEIEPFNRALSGLYPPGSSMKVVTAAAALDTKTVTPDTNVTGPKEYQGVRNFESGEFGTHRFRNRGEVQR